MRCEQPDLFAPNSPDGLRYRAGFIDVAEEERLVAAVRALEFQQFEMRGVVARRRVAFFGESYGREAAAGIPVFLQPLRAKLAGWAGIDPAAFAMALVNEYQPGSPIGWHRDAPQYGIIAGVSLLSPCRMKFRPYVKPQDGGGQRAPRRASHELVLPPRSAYLLTGAARSDFEHHIPPVAELRYSITLRTLRPPRA
jgi:alkylated DNA repair dioxygenase AlkB